MPWEGRRLEDGPASLRTSKIDGKPSQSGKEAPAPALTWDVPVWGAAPSQRGAGHGLRSTEKSNTEKQACLNVQWNIELPEEDTVFFKKKKKKVSVVHILGWAKISFRHFVRWYGETK